MDRSGEMFAIWIGVGMAGIGIGVSGVAGPTALSLFAVLMVAALLATALVMSDQLIKVWRAIEAEDSKAKRAPEDRIALLREVLDDEEWRSFKAALRQQVLAGSRGDSGADDGELPLSALVDAERSERGARQA